jgi:hypothetical protein
LIAAAAAAMLRAAAAVRHTSVRTCLTHNSLAVT